MDGDIISMYGVKPTLLGNPVRNRGKTARDKIALRLMAAHCLYEGARPCGQLSGRKNFPEKAGWLPGKHCHPLIKSRFKIQLTIH